MYSLVILRAERCTISAPATFQPVPGLFFGAMSRLSRDDLHALVYIAIRCAPRLVINGLRSKLPQDGDKATDALAERICNQIDNAHTHVVREGDIPGIPFTAFCDAPPRKG
jgi:hypothetical protein